MNVRIPILIAFLGVGLLAAAPQASANPFTNYFDPLIAELQTRATALSNSTVKAEQTQFKAIQKVLKTLLAKDSTSVGTDLKNAGKVTKSLIKAFPTEFAPTLAAKPAFVSTTLPILLQAIFDQFKSNEVALLDAAQTELNTLPAGTCRDTAQATLDSAAALLASTSGAPDFVALAAILTQGARAIVASEGSVAKAIACITKGSGGCATVTAITADAGGTPFVGGNFIVGQWSPAGGGPGSFVINAQATDGSLINLNMGGCECQTSIAGISSLVLNSGANAGHYGFISGTATLIKYHTGSTGPACGIFSGTAAESTNLAHTISVTGQFTIVNVTVVP